MEIVKMVLSIVRIIAMFLFFLPEFNTGLKRNIHIRIMQSLSNLVLVIASVAALIVNNLTGDSIWIMNSISTIFWSVLLILKIINYEMKVDMAGELFAALVLSEAKKVLVKVKEDDDTENDGNDNT